ncbi:hypothetical protein L6164_008681 [Bauhinia variegata]|uniref:Uncharacterized protein n=1 Tax=Bauhinia variegata TaxID=167791 RepID=A0ACB9PHH4_BAUVA|nr:hypothetical protein L6164_008681 [Bauhinia variegata]
MLKPFHENVEDPSRSISDRAPPVTIKSYDRQIENILYHTVAGKRGVPPTTHYLIKWKGLPESEATWEAQEDLWPFEDHLRNYKERISDEDVTGIGGGDCYNLQK